MTSSFCILSCSISLGDSTIDNSGEGYCEQQKSEELCRQTTCFWKNRKVSIFEKHI